MQLIFHRPRGLHKPGDVAEIVHAGAAKELIRRGIASEFIAKVEAEPAKQERVEQVRKRRG